MKDILAPIDQAGRVVLPKGVRQELAIKPGDMLKITVAGSTVTLTPTKRAAGFVKKGKVLVFTTGDDQVLSSATVNDVIEATRAERGRQTLNETGRSSRGR